MKQERSWKFERDGEENNLKKKTTEAERENENMRDDGIMQVRYVSDLLLVAKTCQYVQFCPVRLFDCFDPIQSSINCNKNHDQCDYDRQNHLGFLRSVRSGRSLYVTVRETEQI